MDTVQNLGCNPKLPVERICNTLMRIADPSDSLSKLPDQDTIAPLPKSGLPTPNLRRPIQTPSDTHPTRTKKGGIAIGRGERIRTFGLLVPNQAL